MSPTTITICATCGYDPQAPDAPRRGSRFAAAVEQALAERGEAARHLRLRRTNCLMACKRACTALVRAPGKYAYVIGDLGGDPAAEAGGDSSAERQAADTLIAFAAGHQASADGVVPYKQWPEGIKGRFIARTPPPDEG